MYVPLPHHSMYIIHCTEQVWTWKEKTRFLCISKCIIYCIYGLRWQLHAEVLPSIHNFILIFSRLFEFVAAKCTLAKSQRAATALGYSPNWSELKRKQLWKLSQHRPFNCCLEKLTSLCLYLLFRVYSSKQCLCLSYFPVWKVTIASTFIKVWHIINLLYCIYYYLNQFLSLRIITYYTLQIVI